jgi:hypothetical protein
MSTSSSLYRLSSREEHAGGRASALMLVHLRLDWYDRRHVLQGCLPLVELNRSALELHKTGRIPIFLRRGWIGWTSILSNASLMRAALNILK